MKADRVISFFIHIYFFGNGQHVQTQTLYNCQTTQRLVIQGYGPNEYPFVKILRLPIGATAEWIEEMDQESEWKYRKIIIDI
jgi:hypothetical protein